MKYEVSVKYLPQQYREHMSDFYGKRGKSWHVSAVITKKEEKFQVECYVHVFDSCTQDGFAVTSIIENLFQVLRKDYSSINKVYLRSDNAGCYHNGPLFLSLSHIAKRAVIVPLRYDFSDPQAGKDICDRKIAPMKAHMRRYVNEKHDIKTAEDMKEALESHGGIKGCRAAVAKVNPLLFNGKGNKIPGISKLNNFSFEKDGIRAWRSFKIGPGLLLKYSALQAEQDTQLELIQEFSPRTQNLGVIAGKKNNQCSTSKHDIYSCNEAECVLTFKTRAEAETHIDTGKHVRKTDRESVYDSIRKTWAEKVTGVKYTTTTMPSDVPESIGQEASLERTTPSGNEQTTGWALKTSKTWTRMGEKARAFLVSKFDAGALSGLKADPVQVSREMKRVKDKDGKLMFTPEEWRTAERIKSFFSRLSAKQRQQQIEPDKTEPAEEDIAAAETEAEQSFCALRDAIEKEMPIPNYPIIANDKDICQLVKEQKLNVLRIAELKVICESLQIEIHTGSEKRKKTYTEPLTEYAQYCSCMQSL